jgi:hypothetical protein
VRGALAQRAWDAVADIGSCLGGLDPRAIASPNLNADLALVHAYLARAQGTLEHVRRATEFLDAAIDGAGALRAPGLHGGFCGVAWTVEHLRAALFDGTAGDPNEDVDHVLLELLTDAWTGPYDLIGGLVGLAVYAAERLANGSTTELPTAIATQLVTWGQRAAWMTPPELLARDQRELAPGGWRNLGVAHGIPGAAVVLSWADATDLQGSRGHPLLDETVALLVAQRIDDPGDTFPCWVSAGAAPVRRVPAWCYGEAGIAGALLHAADLARRPDWASVALDVANALVTRPVHAGDVADAGICHGTIGVAHILNRIYQRTHRAVFAEAAVRWYERALALRRERAAGVAGFVTVRNEPRGRIRHLADLSLLTGTCGTALGLLSAVTDVHPDWDRLLLLSTARPGGPA